METAWKLATEGFRHCGRIPHQFLPNDIEPSFQFLCKLVRDASSYEALDNASTKESCSRPIVLGSVALIITLTDF